MKYYFGFKYGLGQTYYICTPSSTSMGFECMTVNFMSLRRLL